MCEQIIPTKFVIRDPWLTKELVTKCTNVSINKKVIVYTKNMSNIVIYSTVSNELQSRIIMQNSTAKKRGRL